MKEFSSAIKAFIEAWNGSENWLRFVTFLGGPNGLGEAGNGIALIAN